MLTTISDTKAAWRSLSLYQRFEQVVALLLSVLISVVIIVATWNLARSTWDLLIAGVIDVSEPATFQNIFGSALLVLIALEFNHSLLGVFERQQSIVQVRTVVLIALLAVLRKFIVVEVGEAEPFLLIALAAAVLSLGAVFWALRVQDKASAEEKWEESALLHALGDK